MGGSLEAYLRKLAATTLAGLICLIALPAAYAADQVTSYTVLSPDDVKTYGAIFAAQKTGQFDKADTLAAKLEDTSLLGYVLQERYLGPNYRSKFPELKDWLEDYGDLVGADQIYRLAVKRAPKKTPVPAPQRAHWRGAAGDGSAFGDMPVQSDAGERVAAQLRALEREGKPEAADALLRKASLPQGDMDRLGAYVATAYLAENKDRAALARAQEVIARGGVAATQAHWTAGLAAYRLGQFENAAQHFEAVVAGANAQRTYSAAAFWAARSWTHKEQPEGVLTLYERAASAGDTFYGLLATRVLGRDKNADCAEPALDTVSFAGLMLE